MSQTIQVTDDISLTISDTLLGKLALVPKRTGRRNKYRRLSVMRRNLLRDIEALQRESRRHKGLMITTDIYKDTRHE